MSVHKRSFMNTYEITESDLELIQHAKAIIQARYRPDWHHIGAAIRTKTGQMVTGVHIEANVGRVTVCGEAVAIGRAITEGHAHWKVDCHSEARRESRVNI